MAKVTPAKRIDTLPPHFFGAIDRRVAAARAEGVDVIDASKGNPDLPTPEHIVRAMHAAVADPANHGYPSFTVRAGVREGVVERYRIDHGVELDPETQVAAFHGSHEGLMAAVAALVDSGETLVLPDPGYPAYRSAAELAGARVELLPLDRESGYQPHFSVLTELPEAAAVLLNYPNNPTGALATLDTFAKAHAESRRLGAAFIHDFAYSTLGSHGVRPLSALTTGVEGNIEVSTLSKAYNMAGWRFGYAVGDPDLIAAMKRYQSHAYSTIFGATQDAAAAALSGDQSAAVELVEVYERRRNLVVGALREQGWDVFEPEGAFFVWFRSPDPDDVAYAGRLLTEHGVAVAPGSGFGSLGRGYLRLGLVHPEQTLSTLVERLAEAFADAPTSGSSAR
ncbi:aminotransferase class I/II-fold pyridoxal phosphate-dependent enzyme [Amnibacterium flavum]|uniref:Aminotransferase class I/classII large domain-containing protein n=1 Tax=Amnibacterium flavum TaxID=2173173 RepID=A0A2V1HNH2_9MICO|nr:aminotransferase class I/II-fold pyridoxal phosphate-dependent enzyme [Amnibacterium flavum]PVZ94183.1 hypothetical protein DDQ50_10590 [Amnibacterium flavum]